MEAPTEQSEVEVRKEEEVVQGEYGQPSENSAVHEIDTDMVSLSGVGCSEMAPYSHSVLIRLTVLWGFGQT